MSNKLKYFYGDHVFVGNLKTKSTPSILSNPTVTIYLVFKNNLIALAPGYISLHPRCIQT